MRQISGHTGRVLLSCVTSGNPATRATAKCNATTLVGPAPRPSSKTRAWGPRITPRAYTHRETKQRVFLFFRFWVYYKYIKIKQTQHDAHDLAGYLRIAPMACTTTPMAYATTFETLTKSHGSKVKHAEPWRRVSYSHYDSYFPAYVICIYCTFFPFSSRRTSCFCLAEWLDRK